MVWKGLPWLKLLLMTKYYLKNKFYICFRTTSNKCHRKQTTISLTPVNTGSAYLTSHLYKQSVICNLSHKKMIEGKGLVIKLLFRIDNEEDMWFNKENSTIHANHLAIDRLQIIANNMYLIFSYINEHLKTFLILCIKWGKCPR